MTLRTINLTVVGDRSCSTTRMYLAYMNAAGLRPQRLWLVDFRPASSIVHGARRLLGLTLANRLHGLRPSAIASSTPEFIRLCGELQEAAAPRVVDLFGELDAQAYAAEVAEFCAEDFSDPYLQRRMLRHTDTAFLYTNGGIIRPSLLDRPEVRIFHIHPGIVPEVRGSDCLLWSYWARRRLGVSCFYMSSGIDEGAVLGQREFPVPDLSPLRPYLTPESEDIAYRSLLFAVDPHLRAQLLVDVLAEAEGCDLRRLDSTPQPAGARPAYLWMHPRLRLRTMRSMAA